MMSDSDFRQDAVFRCISAGYGVNSDNPYSGGAYYRAYKCSRMDHNRRQRSARVLEQRLRQREHCRNGRYSDDLFEGIARRDEVNRVRRAILRLPAMERQMIEAVMRGDSIKDFARERNITIDSARSIHYRAVLRLREWLAP